MCKTFRCTFDFVVLITLPVEIVAGFQLSLPQLPPRLRTLPPPRLKRCHGPLGSLRQIKTTLVCNSFVGMTTECEFSMGDECAWQANFMLRAFLHSVKANSNPDTILVMLLLQSVHMFHRNHFWPEVRGILREDYNTTDCKHRKILRNLCRTLSRIMKAGWSLTAITDFFWVVPPYSIL